jgi:hypothetical protein
MGWLDALRALEIRVAAGPLQGKKLRFQRQAEGLQVDGLGGFLGGREIVPWAGVHLEQRIVQGARSGGDLAVGGVVSTLLVGPLVGTLFTAARAAQRFDVAYVVLTLRRAKGDEVVLPLAGKDNEETRHIYKRLLGMMQ